MWVYKGKPFTQAEYQNGMHSFVYCIKNNKTGRKYIGKKNFSARRDGKYQFSNWETYQSSNKVVQQWDDVQKVIVAVCYCAFESSYIEAALIIKSKALLSHEYENYMLGGVSIGACPNYMRVDL